MRKKIGLYLLSFVCFTVYALSLNPDFMEWWSTYRWEKLGIADTRTHHGDLYSYCFLPGFTDPPTPPLKELREAETGTDLYIIHDSYLLSKIKKENFKGLHKLIMSDYRGDGISVKPDPSKKNILIIETSERTADWRLKDLANMFAKLNVDKNLPVPIEKKDDPKRPWRDYIFNENINHSLEYNLFEYRLFFPVREFKALINYNWFGRISKDVVLSTDKKHLLLKETIDTSLYSSSFRKIRPDEIANIVNSVNAAVQHYRENGFNEVYISIIPNPVSIVDTERMPYNHKIDLICGDTSLKAQSINVYPLFKNAGQQLYLRDDSHWNTNGIQLWVDEVNKKVLGQN